MDFGATLGKPKHLGQDCAIPAESTTWTSSQCPNRSPHLVSTYLTGPMPNIRAIPAAGGFEAATFRPDEWIPDYPNPSFLNRLPDDEFWAAKQVMAFTDEQIRTIVKVAQVLRSGC